MQPLEKALISSGAVKICQEGDPGKGPDNSDPWYNAYFTVSKSGPEARSLLEQLAHKNNTPLIAASPENRGHLTVDNAFINDWYYGQKDNFYTSASVYTDKTDSICNQENLISDAQSVVAIRARIK